MASRSSCSMLEYNLGAPEPPVTVGMEDIEGVENKNVLSDLYCDNKEGMLEKTAAGLEEMFPELEDIVKFPSLDTEDGNEELGNWVAMQNIGNHGCMSSSKEWSTPCFSGFQEVDLGVTFGLRRAYRETSTTTTTTIFNSSDTNCVLQPQFEHLLTVDDHKMEERRQKLSRYRKKKTERNFGRKIKYACRKTLADNQPRVRGRFVCKN